MRGPKAVAVLAAAAVLGLSACSAGGGAGGDDVSREQSLEPGAIGAVDQLYSRPEVADIGDVSITLDESFQDYNNNTGAANSQANAYFYPLWTPSPFFVDGDFSLKLDRDYMESVTVKSTDPQVIEYKWRPEVVWSDGTPVGCKDMYLTYLAAVSPTRAFDSPPAGYEQISKFECSPDGKTVTVTFRVPFADYRGMWAVAGQAGSQLLPAHILEQRTGIPDITKVPVNQDTPEVRRAGEFYTKGWNDFNPAVALSAGPLQDRERGAQPAGRAGAQRPVVGQPGWSGQDHRTGGDRLAGGGAAAAEQGSRHHRAAGRVGHRGTGPGRR